MPRQPATRAQPKESGAQTQEPDFEAALQRLEAIVAEMETGQLPLRELIARYEEGLGLARLCSRQLEDARGRIETLTLEPSTTPATPEPGTAAHPSHDDEEPSLF